MIANNERRYAPLIAALIEKTETGKLYWEETAAPDRYLAAVRGLQTYQVARHEDPVRYQLTVRDEDGNVFLDFSESDETSALSQLFKRVANSVARIDERIGKSVQLLNSL